MDRCAWGSSCGTPEFKQACELTAPSSYVYTSGYTVIGHWYVGIATEIATVDMTLILRYLYWYWSLYCLRAGPAKPLPERWIDCAPLNTVLVRTSMWIFLARCWLRANQQNGKSASFFGGPGRYDRYCDPKKPRKKATTTGVIFVFQATQAEAGRLPFRLCVCTCGSITTLKNSDRHSQKFSGASQYSHSLPSPKDGLLAMSLDGWRAGHCNWHRSSLFGASELATPKKMPRSAMAVFGAVRQIYDRIQLEKNAASFYGFVFFSNF